MALFTVQRYLGDEEAFPDSERSERAKNILKAIESDAKKRKRRQIKESNERGNCVSLRVGNIDTFEEENGTVKNKHGTNISSATNGKLTVTDDSNRNSETKRKRKTTLGATDSAAETNGDEASRAETVGKNSRKPRRESRPNLSPREEAVVDGRSLDTTTNTAGSPVEDGDVEVGGDADTREEPNDNFTVIGSYQHKHTEKVDRVLPHWLTHPAVINADIRDCKVSFNDVPGLDQSLIKKLEENGITEFFPVQSQLIPALLASFKTGFLTGPCGRRPSDVCCSAPTGSGKTLAFVLPIVQGLMSRTVCRVRALVVLPVQDLATQVYRVFQTYCQGSKLKVGLVTGQKVFGAEQLTLVKNSYYGSKCLVDIVVATPGRLVDHINKTDGFSLTELRFLVIDEADRMMDEVRQDWLVDVERAAYSSPRRPPERNITLASMERSCLQIPLQKLLFSATLSQNPEKLERLNLFQPKLFTSVMNTTSGIGQKDNSNKSGEFVGKYTTPAGLTEFYTECKSQDKPLVILHFLHQKRFRNILCFTNSTEATHRLYQLVRLYGGLEVREFSSKLNASRRTKVLKEFESGKIDMLICSDAMARGMDVSHVRYVVSYDSPRFPKTYIHRVGRTARAGKAGTAVTLLETKEIFHFKKMIKSASKTKLKELKLRRADLKPFVPKYREILQELAQLLETEKLT